MKDYYKILEVDRTAPVSEIKKSFRNLAHKYHPDKKGGNESKFREISEAYSVLSNETKKSKYDNQNSSGGQGFSYSSGNDSMQFDMSDIFSMFGGAGKPKGERVVLDVNVTLRESLLGAEKEIKIPYRTKPHKNIKFKIPAGIRHGEVISERGMGEDVDGGASGDLYIRFNVTPDRIFYVNAEGMPFQDINISFLDAVDGVEKSIETIEGKSIKINISANTVNGNILRVRKKGVEEFYVRVHIAPPKKITGKAREALNVLRNEGW